MPEQADAAPDWSRRTLSLAALVYSAIVPWAYVRRVHPIFEYMGFTYHAPALGWIVAAVVLGALPAVFWLPVNFDRPSHLILTILYVVVYVPSVTIPFLALPEPGAYAPMGLAILACFFLVTTFARRASLAIPLPPFTGINLDRVMLAVAIAGSAFVMAQLGFRGIPSLLDVYDVRSDYVEQVENAPVILSYVINWLAHVVFAYFIARGICFGRPWMWILGIAGDLYIYSLTGFKSVLFSMVLILLVVLLFRTRKDSTVRIIVGVVAAVAAFSLFDDLTGGFLATGIFTSRVLMVPGLLTGFYFDFFSANPKLMLLHSVFKWAGTNPYPVPYPAIIAEVYLNTRDGYANANFLADAFANFGIPGMLVFSVLLGIILWVLDSLSEGMDLRYSASLSILAFFTLTNSALLTSLLTFGILFLLLVLWLHGAEGPATRTTEGA